MGKWASISGIQEQSKSKPQPESLSNSFICSPFFNWMNFRKLSSRREHDGPAAECTPLDSIFPLRDNIDCSRFFPSGSLGPPSLEEKNLIVSA